MIKAGADPNEPNSQGIKPIFLGHSDLSTLKALKEGGADVHVVDEDQNTVLHHACWWHINAAFLSFRALRSSPIIELLISYGVDVNKQNSSLQVRGYMKLIILLQTALHLYATSRASSYSTPFKNCNPDPTIQDINGNTPLHLGDLYLPCDASSCRVEVSSVNTSE